MCNLHTKNRYYREKFVKKAREKYIDFHEKIVYNISYRARFVERRTLMKKDYMKPEGKVVAMSVRENIASSTGSTGDTYKVYYSVNPATGEKFIQGSDVPATVTNNEAFNSFYDMVQIYLNREKLGNCRVAD